ncbi:D-arabinono-1,4-lactone oxidase [Rhodotorula toruloides]|uniref:D-arabinono-1,4-lactone oxidase n=1 Tax=Rhodotorula toruloides TaxID=5286 RepID=A0A511KQB1_RHOTO|nr:D-arabinono-1,4-lactone oxidase [Rhodotorula toruloides]
MAPLPPPEQPALGHLSSADLRRLVAPFTILAGPPLRFTNWATTFTSTAQAVFRPVTVEHVRWAVELARRDGIELRAAGAGHSPSDIVCTGGYILDLKGLNKVLDVDPTSQTFHAEGGIVLRDLHTVLLEKGSLAMSCLGSISDQTLAGAISTSTHGSGVSFPSISTCATFLDIVLPLPSAPVVRCSRDPAQDPDLFHAALCGIGAVGIVVGVGMRVERAFKLEEEVFSMRFDDFNKRWREIAESAEHVRCWWFPQVGRVKISRLNRTTKAITAPASPLTSFLSDVLLAKHIHALALSLARYFPSLLPYHAWFMWTFREQPGPVSWRVFLRGVWEKVSGRIKGSGVWPSVEGLEEMDEERKRQEEQLVEEEGEKGDRPASPASSVDIGPSPSTTARPTSPPFKPIDTDRPSRSSKLPSLPSDLLTPPYTPPALSPTSSPPRLARSIPPLAITSTSSSPPEIYPKSGRPKLPWPILEDEPSYRVDTSVRIFNYDCGFPQYTYESCVPYSRTGLALYSLNAWHTTELAKPGYPLKAHFPIEIRWTEKDDGWLSPTGQGRGCYLGAIQYRPFNLPVPYRSYFSHFASLLHFSFSGKPHWAKSHHLSPRDLRALYPRFDDWLEVRKRVDPEGVLVNEYVRRHLVEEREEEEGKEGEGDGREVMERRVRRWKIRP